MPRREKTRINPRADEIKIREGFELIGRDDEDLSDISGVEAIADPRSLGSDEDPPLSLRSHARKKKKAKPAE